jgi:pimeloyl-ACP methyl ester carboxylesterase
MNQHSHQTAPTQFIEANGIRFAYRQFGKAGGVPLVFMQHFRGGMDHWDPTVTDGFAEHRRVTLFDNAGVAASTGETPHTIDAMADHASDFIGALRLAQVDLLDLRGANMRNVTSSWSVAKFGDPRGKQLAPSGQKRG